jgi:hypothetical protein
MYLPPSPFLVVDATKDKVTLLEVALVATFLELKSTVPMF